MKTPWTEIAKGYAKDALDKKNIKRFGKWIRLAADRFIKDLERARKDTNSFCYSEVEADKVCDFISNLPHVEGEWKSDNITLEPFQVFFLCNLFGFRNLDGTRRFTSALFAIARKNGKSSLAAGVGLYCLTMEGERGPHVISAATTGDQAAIVFKIAKRMADKTPKLREAFNLECFTRAISCYENGGLFKSINAKASTQDGLNPSCAILDEIHAHKAHDLLNVLQSAAGGRRSPLFLFTTTEGYETPGPWPEMRKFGQQVLEGVIDADHFLVIFYAIDDKDNEFDESIWEKASPLLAVSEPLLKAIRKESTEAKSMPGRHAEFLIKRMNRQSSTANGWIDLQKWKACSGIVPLNELKDDPCYGALDLASTRDLASFRIVWKKDGILYTHGWRWVPHTTVAIRTQRNLVPYAGWVKSGYMIETQGEVTDYDEIFKKVLWVRDNFNLVAVAFDQWNAAQIASKILAEGIAMTQFIQGPKSYHPAMKNFEETYISGKFRHGADPVLTWCASNIVLRLDANMNMAPDKKKSADKIDDITALLMANGIMIGQDTGEEGSFDDFLNDPISIRQ
jgi:phage terminase large subunit-like protein